MKTQLKHLIIYSSFRRAWLLLFILFMHWDVVQAQTFQGEISTSLTYHVYTDGDKYYFNTETARWDGFGYFVITNGAKVDFIFHTSKTIRMTGQIRIEKGTVNMSIASDYAVPSGEPTLRRTNTTQNLFHVHNSETDINQCKLNITGLPGKPFIIDGAANISFSGNNATGWSASNSGYVSKGTLLLLQGGMATLNYVDLRNNWFYLEDAYGSKQCEGGAVHLTTNGFVDYADSDTNPKTWLCNSECVLTMNHCNISKCAARRWGSAIGLFGPKMNDNLSLAKLTDCSVTECFNLGNGVQSSGPGGTIRTAGNTYCKLEMTRCTVSNNKANCVGGGVFWENSVSPPLEMTDCVIEGNYTSSTAGGVDLRSPAVLKGCKIRNNYAKSNGGGLTYQPYAGPSTAYRPNNYFPKDASITLDANTEITGNHSESDGGGMHINVYPMNFAYAGDGSQGWTVFFSGNSAGTGYTSEQYKINIELNGATISNNSADGNGGGIYMIRNTDIYQTNVVFDFGKVENNTAGGVGGACYILSNIPIATNPTGSNSPYNYYESNYYASYAYPSTCPFKNTNMNVELGSATASGNLNFTGNTAEFGGGLFVDVQQSTTATTSVLNTTVFGNALVGTEAYPNIASEGSGGAMYINNGNILLKGGEIKYNTATVNGGGIYPAGTTNLKVDAGNFSVQHNTVNGVPNNLYLPTDKTIEVVSGDFNPEYLGIYTQETATAAKRTKFPVFTVANVADSLYLRAIYNGMKNGTMNVIDDRQIHSAEYSHAVPNILYFGIGSPWSPYQQTVRKSTDLVDSNGDGVYEIGNIKQLTAFLWYVNGITTHDATFTPAVPGANGILTADINMENHYWMPFADYSGIFDGNGHVITGITMVPSNTSTGRGLFGTTASGADIKNVTLDDCQFFAPSSGTCYVGSIISDLSAGKVSNSVANLGVNLTASGNASAVLGGIAGRVSGGTLHSSIAMAEMTGYTMGGLVGQITSGNLYNSFANPQFDYTGESGTNAKFVGGLVAENSGTVANCYVRFSRPQSLTDAKFGQLAGSIGTGGSVSNCYTPSTFISDVPSAIVSSGNATASYTYEITDAPYLYTRSSDNKVTGLGTTLTKALNGWVDRNQNQGYAKWNRSTAGGYSYTYDDGRGNVTVTGGNINDDYPLPKMQGLCCAASPDGLTIDYKKSLDDMITKYNGLRDGGTIWLYDSPKEDDGSNEFVSETNDGDVLLYIDEDASLLQSSSANNTLTAYTGQTLKTYSTGNRWHLFSSPLKESKIGISYTNNSVVGFSWASDPCGVQFSADNDNALFPSDMPVNAFDLYSFYEPEYHWINFRRNSLSHWHENAHEVKINYNGNGINTSVAPYNSDDYSNDGNEPILVPGKGYLVSINQEQLVQNKGVLNNGNVVVCNVTKTNFNAWAERLGFNLLGNPYQSYLDFNEFVNQNGSNLWEGTSEYTNTYATYDPAQKAYVQYTLNPSQGANTASRYIHPHQGFFVRMTKGSENTNTTTVTYTNDMRTNATDTQSGFRDGETQPAYPLVNFTVRDEDGNADVAVLEIGRPADEGAPKMRLGDCTGALSLGHEGKDYGILFRTEVEDYQPLRFEAMEAGTFTLTWNTANADFEHLTLIDNIAGTETDMLVRDSYRFEATADQYASRFKVVIGDYKGIDEPEPAEGPAESFAFQMGDQLVVNGEGNLQVVDMLGRVVMTERLTSSQNMVGLPKAAGVYVLRLTDGGGTRTQKMVVGL